MPEISNSLAYEYTKLFSFIPKGIKYSSLLSGLMLLTPLASLIEASL